MQPGWGAVRPTALQPESGMAWGHSRHELTRDDLPRRHAQARLPVPTENKIGKRHSGGYREHRLSIAQPGT
jgi:hypothetical protein